MAMFLNVVQAGYGLDRGMKLNDLRLPSGLRCGSFNLNYVSPLQLVEDEFIKLWGLYRDPSV
jgi:hypothetical protein